jgi:hypothetical protein
MASNTEECQALRFQIEPAPGETQRACAAIARAVLPASRASAILIAIYAAIIAAAWFLTPATRAVTVIIGVTSVLATVSALQADGRSRVRRLSLGDPHSRETHYVELGPEGVHTWCAHLDARYPWSDFIKVSETPEFYLFIRPSGNGAAIPKRLLDDVRASELRQQIRAWAPDLGAALSL